MVDPVEIGVTAIAGNWKDDQMRRIVKAGIVLYLAGGPPDEPNVVATPGAGTWFVTSGCPTAFCPVFT